MLSISGEHGSPSAATSACIAMVFSDVPVISCKCGALKGTCHSDVYRALLTSFSRNIKLAACWLGASLFIKTGLFFFLSYGMCVCICVHMSLCMNVCVCLCVCVCACMFMHVCVYICLYVCMNVDECSAIVCMWRKLFRSLSFHHVGPGDQTLVVGLGCEYLDNQDNPLSHLACLMVA